LAKENAETNGWNVTEETTAVTEQFCAAVKTRWISPPPIVRAPLMRLCAAPAGKHPVFPAPSDFRPSDFRGRTSKCKPRTQCAARARNYIHRHCERSEAIHIFTCSAMACFAALAMTGMERCPWNP